MEDSRIKHAWIMLKQANETSDDTYALGLLLEARKTITEIIQEF